MLLWLLGFPGHALDIARLESDLETVRAKAGVAAVGLLIVSPEQTLHANLWGIADRARYCTASPESTFRVGSITKTFTGLLALRLAQNGLDLDMPVADLLGELAPHNPWHRKAPITLAQLLEHTAGLTDLSQEEFDYNEADFKPLKATLKRYRKHRIARWHPGLHSEYSNAGYGLAGLVLEQLGDADYEILMRREVFTPLGMARSGFREPTPGSGPCMLRGYDTDGSTAIPWWHMVYRPFGGLNTTLADMAVFLRMLLKNGSTKDDERFLPAAAIERLRTPRTTLAARQGLKLGYGLGQYAWLRDGQLFYGHGGDADGYLAHYGYSPALQRGYFLVINAFQGKTLRRMRVLVEQALTAEAKVNAPFQPPLAGEIPADYAGRWQQSTWRFGTQARSLLTVHASITEQGLLLDYPSGRQRLLVKTAPGLFRYADEPLASVMIAAGPDGKLILQTPHRNFVRLP